MLLWSQDTCFTLQKMTRNQLLAWCTIKLQSTLLCYFHLLEHGWLGRTGCVFMVVYRWNLSVFHPPVIYVHVPHHSCLPQAVASLLTPSEMSFPLLCPWLFYKALFWHLCSVTYGGHLRLQLSQGSVSSNLIFIFLTAAPGILLDT